MCIRDSDYFDTREAVNAIEAGAYEKLPYTSRVLAENLVRRCDPAVLTDSLKQLIERKQDLDFPWYPARVVTHDILGQTALVDLAGLRDAIADMGGDPAKVNPVVPVQLIVDHSLAVECGGFDPDAFAKNRAIEDRRNEDRFHFIEWTKTAFKNVDVIPAGNGIMWPVVKKLAIGLLIGSLIGAQIAHAIPARQLEMIIGCFALLTAAQMFTGWKGKLGDIPLPQTAGLATAGGGIGIASAIFGIGGGTFTVPYLTLHGVAMANAVACASACGLPIALAGAVGFIYAGWHEALLPSGAVGFVYFPAFLGISTTSLIFARLGATLAHRLPKEKGLSIRIGVNAGSLEKDLQKKYGEPTGEALSLIHISEPTRPY